ncbi:MAG TPA: glycosyltransferase, partial [Arenimonas sp.]
GRVRAWRDAASRRQDAPLLALWLWVLLPLLVFCVARSRLPLYVLPLFLPIAVLVARQWQAEGRSLPRIRWIAVWVIVLLGLRLASALWPSNKDAGRWADALSARTDHRVEEVVFVEDMARYGLHLHMGVAVEKVSLEPRPREPYGAEFDSSFAGELLEREDALWVTKQALFPQLIERAAPLGFRLVPQGEPYEGRVVFRVER